MGICDTLDNWNEDGPSSERFTELRDFVNDLLTEWGFDTPNWSDQMPDGYEDSAAVYIDETETIHLNPDLLAGDEGVDAVNIAIHEGLHAAIDQAGWEMSGAAEEWEAASLGAGVGEELLEGCEDPTESGAPRDMPSYPWTSRER